jgi:hypothetical protein
MVVVHPPLVEFLSQDRADQLEGDGLFADDPSGMRSSWRRIGEMWSATIDRARRLPDDQLDQRVAGEWSFIETLRHLIFVTDAWVGDVIGEDPARYHPWGMPPDFLVDAARDLGLNVDARPSLDETVDVRQTRVDEVGRVVGALSSEELARTCAPREGRFKVVGALQTVMFEEWAHHQYATRDLARVEARERER